MDDAYATGSSIMPQKKNPDVAELVRGKTGRVVGDLTALLVMLKGLPLAYNKDMQEDKEPLFDAVDTLGRLRARRRGHGRRRCASTRTRCASAAEGGFMAATDLADHLVGTGLPFREAHEVVGELVAKCEADGRTLQDLTAEDLARRVAALRRRRARRGRHRRAWSSGATSAGGTGHDGGARAARRRRATCSRPTARGWSRSAESRSRGHRRTSGTRRRGPDAGARQRARSRRCSTRWATCSRSRAPTSSAA